MLSQRTSIVSSDEDDDNELPSLAERIKASFALQNQKIPHAVHLSSDSEDEDSSFLKFSEKIQSTPCPQSKFSSIDVFERTEELKISINEDKKCPPPVNIRLDFTSDSEDEESQFLSFSQRIQSTPQVKVLEDIYISSESDSDDQVFSNLTERLNLLTPMSENKENFVTTDGPGVAKKMSEFLTPLPPNKKIPLKAMDSESDESFSNFIEILRTPMSVKKISQKTVDSESDESFTSFVERLKTPLTTNRKIQNRVLESDSDDSFLNSSRKQAFQTPRSQRKSLKGAISLPNITEKNHCNSLMVKDTPNTVKTCRSENEKEFKMLFQPECIDARFQENRKSYTYKLYEFYNRKVFNSRLPPDMPLVYDGALKSTAGITCCSVKNGTYTCLIKLSSPILITFDRLKETLLHEMCHAAVWIVNKQQRVRHGPLWQVWASRCKLILPFIECPTRCHNYEISYSVWYQCPKCQWKKGRCKQVKKYHGALCSRCKTPIVMTHA